MTMNKICSLRVTRLVEPTTNSRHFTWCQIRLRHQLLNIFPSPLHLLLLTSSKPTQLNFFEKTSHLILNRFTQEVRCLHSETSRFPTLDVTTAVYFTSGNNRLSFSLPSSLTDFLQPVRGILPHRMIPQMIGGINLGMIPDWTNHQIVFDHDELESTGTSCVTEKSTSFPQFFTVLCAQDDYFQRNLHS